MASGTRLDFASFVSIGRGTLVLVSLDPTRGHEQAGTRPCVVVSDPEVSASARFPMLAVVPVTSTEGVGALYPPLEPRPGGLRRRSWALIDQLRCVDKRRVVRAFEDVDPDELQAIEQGLRLLLGL